MILPEGTPNRKADILTQILAETRAGLPALRLRRDTFEAALAERPAPPSFVEALRDDRVALIAEIKRRSPSAGVINATLDPVRLAEQYARGGARAVSVLTEATHFGGRVADLEAVAGAVHLPRLRKDFIVDEIQLLEAAAAGASAVLLIVRALGEDALARLLEQAGRLGLGALVEAHDRAELTVALGVGARVVGINARNLDDFRIDVAASLELIATIPADRVAVAESGMTDRAAVERAAEAGADAVLIGGALAGAADPAARTRDLASVPRRER